MKILTLFLVGYFLVRFYVFYPYLDTMEYKAKSLDFKQSAWEVVLLNGKTIYLSGCITAEYID